MGPDPGISPEGYRATRYTHSDSLLDVLTELGCTVLLSTYQAGQLVGVGVHDGKVEFSFHRLDQAMGIAVRDTEMAVGSRTQVWHFEERDVVDQVDPAGRYDRCFVPRRSIVTGRIQGHEMAWGTGADGEPELWVVNTLFSCLVGLDPEYSFVPRWRPPFVSKLVNQDRCHLNGLAMRGGAPAFVTVMAASDEPAGWRARRNDSGAVLSVPDGEVVTGGLAMPHSPRWHQGRLFVLNSGLGRLEHVDLATGRREVVALFPGYARGLAIHAGHAFVGLSRIRETAIFGGAPIADYHDRLKCGVAVVDLASGATVATLEFHTGIEEMFDVQVLADTRCVSFGGDEGVWLVPAPA